MTQNTRPNKKLSAIFKNSKEKISHQAKLLLEKIISTIYDDKKETFINQLLQDTNNKKDYFNNSFIGNLLKTLTSAKLDTSNIIKLVASDGTNSEYFGYSVAISDTKIVIGAHYNDDKGSKSGSAYVYDLDGSNEIKLTASDGTANNYFGYSVAVSNTKIVIGAYGSDANGVDSGCAYIYDLDGSNEIKLIPSDGIDYDNFGCSVAVSDTKIVIGAYGNNDNGFYSGCAYIYDLDGTNEIKLTASDGTDYDNFGYSVAVSNTKIVIGTYYDHDNGFVPGSAYIYDLDGSNEIKLTPSDGTADDDFGYSVAVSDSKIVIGAYGDEQGSYSGSAYVYDLDGTNEIKITASDGANSEYFGKNVAVSDTKIVIGACSHSNKGSRSGSVYIYDLDGSNEIKLPVSNETASGCFGNSLAVSTTKIVLGKYCDDDNGYNAGCVYIFG